MSAVHLKLKENYNWQQAITTF